MIDSIPKTAELVRTFRQGYLYQQHHVLFFKSKSKKVLTYPISLLAKLEEWSGRAIPLTADFKKTVNQIKTYNKNSIPVRAIFKDGFSTNYAVISISPDPPDEFTFTRAQYCYMADVASIEVSPKVYPNAILSALIKLKKESDKALKDIMKLNGNLLENPEYSKYLKERSVFVKDANGKTYKFLEPETFIYRDDLNASDLKILENPSNQQKANALLLSLDRTEYERTNYKSPVETTIIYATP